MRIGDLRRRVTVQQRTATQDSYGQQVLAWNDLLTNVPAAITALSGRELQAAQGMNAEVTHEIVVRWSAALAMPSATAAMRVLYGSRVFEIKGSLNDDAHNRQITLMAAEGLTQG